MTWKNILYDKIRDLACDPSGYRTSLKSSLKKHIKRHHIQRIKQNVKICQLCQFTAASEDSLTEHLMAILVLHVAKFCEIFGVFHEILFEGWHIFRGNAEENIQPEAELSEIPRILNQNFATSDILFPVSPLTLLRILPCFSGNKN